MRFFGSIAVVLALLRPAPAGAQTVTLADIVGAWVGGNVGGNVDDTGKQIGKTAQLLLVFRADSTFLDTGLDGYTGKERFTTLHALRGDTIMLNKTAGAIVVRKPAERQLVFTSLAPGGGWGPKGWKWIYTRNDSLSTGQDTVKARNDSPRKP